MTEKEYACECGELVTIDGLGTALSDSANGVKFFFS